MEKKKKNVTERGPWCTGSFLFLFTELRTLKIICYWSRVALQCCVCESAVCIHISTLCWLSSPFITEHGVQFPELYNRFSLVIYFIHRTSWVQMLHWSFLGALPCALWEGPREVSFVWGNTSMPWPWIRDLNSNLRLAIHCKESWAQKNWCFWTVVLEKTLESPLDCKEIQPVHPRGDQSWVFIGRTDVEAETPILWPPHVKNWLIWKDPDAGKDWGREKRCTTEDEKAGWHHWLNEREFEQAPGVGDGQGGLACCSPWHHKESDTTERLNWTDSFGFCRL